MAATQKSTTEIEKAKKLNHVPWCDEFEKMISGMLYLVLSLLSLSTSSFSHKLTRRPSYDSMNPALAAARFKARAWAHEYNTYFPASTSNPNFESLAAERLERLRDILGHVGDDVFLEPPFRIDYGCNINLGNRVYANFNLTILDCSLVTVGDRVMFGPNVSVFAATHETEVQSRREDVEYGRPVVIG
ncbi:trimeric LpxA-like protein [Bimuria novae-zelandiae CBS 107.79]|uniref:Trimeric LpxA-like protein n=1 Tax=Bimuria novae-zelandiae CBS 107.79 TaxID=1447943 RepID=A0A6A5VAK6_9PLEO|nr:trimeric LpxA-like protein [Bimuria novae-zelandiae CBS 107.79]